MKTLGIALLAIGLTLTPLAAAPAATDASAVAAFFSLGLAAAPADFATARGAQTFSNEYGTTWTLSPWPDRTRFANCWTGHDLADDFSGSSEEYYYKCESTPRANDVSLFTKIERLVRADLPSGYASTGTTYDDMHRPSEVWRRANSPDVVLDAYALIGKDLGKAAYSLAIQIYP